MKAEGVVEEEVVVVELEGMTGFPAIAVSKLLVEQHLVPGVQVHDEDAGQAAGSDLQLLGEVPLELQGVGLKGGQARFPAQRSPCHPQS